MYPSADLAPLSQSATLRRLLYEALSELGHEPATIYRGANQYRRLLPPPSEGRLSHDEAPLFWQAADALTSSAGSETVATFLAVHVAEPAVSVSEPWDDRIELVLKGGSVLRVGRGFDAVTLGRLLDVVERRS